MTFDEWAASESAKAEWLCRAPKYVLATYESAYDAGRAQAIEEAAGLCEKQTKGYLDWRREERVLAKELARRIRALAKGQKP